MKIPKNAKRVFKGVIYDVYQWQQKMFDSSYQTFEMMDRPNTVTVIPTQKDKIFIANETQPMVKKSAYSLFGGRIEKGESILRAAKRELLEESGLKSNDWELIKFYEPHYRIDWKIYLLVAKNCQQITKQNLDAGEKIKVKKVSFNQFLKIVDSKNFWGKDFANDLFRIKQNKKELAKFKKMIFG